MISNAVFAQENRPLGTDVSSYQPTVNWTNMKADGIYFAWTKGTEGTYYKDADFVSHVTTAVAAGVPIGAYHFARPSDDPNITGANSADTEAQYFWGFVSNYVTGGGHYLVPMLDWEDTGITGNSSLTASVLSQWVNEWCNDISNYARAQGVTVLPVVYTGNWYSDPANGYAGLTNTGANSVTNWLTWVSDYPSCTSNAACACLQCGTTSFETSSPTPAYPWPNWNIWQYGDTNWSGGDSDVFNGTTNQFLQLFLIGGTNAPRITTNLVNATVAQGSNVTLTFSVSGGVPLYYHWQFDGTNVAAITNYNTNSVQYSLSNIQLTNAGAYVVQVSNAFGSASSATAFVSVTSAASNATGSVLAPSGLVNWWPGNGNGIDIVAGNNCSPVGGFYYGAGMSGMSFHFNGSTSYLLVTNLPADVPVPWTACMWVYRQQTPQNSGTLLSDGTNTLKLEQYDNTHYVGISKSEVTDWYFTNTSGSGGYTVPLNTWTHLTFVASGSTTTLYVNGVEQGTPINTAFPLGRYAIGSTDFPTVGYIDYMEGNLANVMLFNKALTQAQIQSIYDAGAAGVVAAPQLTSFSTAANGNITFGLIGLTGSKNFTVYYSTNLPYWSVLTSTLSASTGSNNFTVTPTNGGTFYRAMQP